MYYKSGKVGDLGDWEFGVEDYKKDIQRALSGACDDLQVDLCRVAEKVAAKCFSEALTDTFQSLHFPIELDFVGENLRLRMLFSTDESESNTVTWTQSIVETAEWSNDDNVLETIAALELAISDLKKKADGFDKPAITSQKSDK